MHMLGSIVKRIIAVLGHSPKYQHLLLCVAVGYCCWLLHANYGSTEQTITVQVV